MLVMTNNSVFLFTILTYFHYTINFIPLLLLKLLFYPYVLWCIIYIVVGFRYNRVLSFQNTDVSFCELGVFSTCSVGYLM